VSGALKLAVLCWTVAEAFSCFKGSLVKERDASSSGCDGAVALHQPARSLGVAGAYSAAAEFVDEVAVIE